MKIEELAHTWSSIKKILVTRDDLGVDFGGDIIYLRNDAKEPIYMATVASVSAYDINFTYEWGDIAATNTSYPIMPGETVGPLFAFELFFSVNHSPSYLTVITKEVR